MRSEFKKGFTLIEVCAVLLLLGVVALIAIPKIHDFSKVSAELEVLKSHLRYVQFKAMNDDVNNYSWGLRVSDNGYTLICTPSCASVPNLPNETSSTHTPVDGVSITYGFSSIVYNLWGSPSVDGKTPTTDAITINISDGMATKTISIIPNTGFIQ